MLCFQDNLKNQTLCLSGLLLKQQEVDLPYIDRWLYEPGQLVQKSNNRIQ